MSAFELLMSAGAAGVNAEQCDAVLLEDPPVVPQLTKLLASAGRCVHDVEDKHYWAATVEIGEPNDVAGLIGKLKIRRLGADRKQLAAE